MIAKPGLGSLLLLGAAAYGAYKYSQMTDEQKNELKEKGRKFFDENLGGLKNIFGGQPQTANAGGYGQQNGYGQNDAQG